MNSVNFSRPLGLSVIAALVTSALPFAAASAAPAPQSLVATSHDGPAFAPTDYTAGDITVQATDSAAKPVDVDDSQDLSFTWTVTPFGPNATPVLVPATGADVQTTDVNGSFVVPLPVAAGPGVYQLSGGLGTDVATSLLKVTVGNAVPAGSTAVITGLAGSKPGVAQGGTLTVSAPGNTPVAGQVFSLTVDHGFFTTGNQRRPSVVGAPAGDLEQLGTTLTGLTDANGQIPFAVGIGRDAGFDDDGAVAATVRISDGVSGARTASWASANPLNGRVAVTLSAAGEQENPVNPALAGNRTFYDVFALDQFGNRVGGVPIELSYGGYLKDWDYSDDDTISDFDAFGDIWVLSNVAARIDVIGTWEDAPTSTYSDGSGTAVTGTKDTSGTAVSSTYELQFGASSFSIASSVSDTVRIGTTVTHTVRVVDQQGNPVSGYEVRFLRYGPDDIRGDIVATRTTNVLGEATYSFIGTRRGRAAITAEVTNGTSRRELTASVAFGAVVKARLARTRTKTKSRSSADRLTISTRAEAAGARVQLYKIVKGKQILVGSKTLNRKGTAGFTIRDRKRGGKTMYRALVRSTSNSIADQSNSTTIR